MRFDRAIVQLWDVWEAENPVDECSSSVVRLLKTKTFQKLSELSEIFSRYPKAFETSLIHLRLKKLQFDAPCLASL